MCKSLELFKVRRSKWPLFSSLFLIILVVLYVVCIEESPEAVATKCLKLSLDTDSVSKTSKTYTIG